MSFDFWISSLAFPVSSLQFRVSKVELQLRRIAHQGAERHAARDQFARDLRAEVTGGASEQNHSSSINSLSHRVIGSLKNPRSTAFPFGPICRQWAYGLIVRWLNLVKKCRSTSGRLDSPDQVGSGESQVASHHHPVHMVPGGMV